MGNRSQKGAPLPIDWDTSVPIPKLICQLERPAMGPRKDKAPVPGSASESFDKRGGPNIRSQTLWKPDIYANAFVTDALKGINRSPASVIDTPAINGIDFSSYISTFAGSHFLSVLEPYPFPRKSEETISPGLEDLHPSNYRQHFEDALASDLEARVPELRSYDLFGLPFEFTDLLPEFISLKVPGLKDGTPFVSFGDIVMLRQLILDPVSGRPQGMDAWLAPGGGMGRGEQAPGFTGYQVNAIVTGIDKHREKLFIRAYGMIWADQLFCNVSFAVQHRLVQATQRAVVEVAQQLHRGLPDKRILDASEAEFEALSETRARQLSQLDVKSIGYGRSVDEKAKCTWLQRVLFPEEAHGIQRITLPSATFSQSWFDISLNYEQKKAVDAIQSRNYGDLCFLVNGPPGTGKTKTMCEVVLQLANDPEFHGSILLCAPSNQAADTLAIRLRHHFDPTSLLRLNDFSRTFAEVPHELLPFCFVDNQVFSLPPISTLIKFKVVITTCQAADILVQARVTNRDLALLQERLTSMLRKSSHQDVFPLHWTALLVDEAAQATEPENLIPLSVVAPPKALLGQPPTFVMAGDQHQLNPRTYSQSTTLPISLFERLSETHVYASHPLARKHLHYSSQRLLMLQPPFVNLVRNYRSHPAILAVPSSLFYSNTLIPEASRVNSSLAWTGWRGRRWPVLFACNAGIDACHDILGVGRGWYNMHEAQKAISYAQSVLNQGLITDQSEICIMSPFQAQVNLLRQLARQRKLSAVNIGPMEAFQGLESRFVIICTTRARKRFIEEDNVRGIGIVNEQKKFNVAITRAKEGLIVLGNPWSLAVDPCWAAFLEFCWRNGLWQPEQGMTKDIQETQVDLWRPPSGSETLSGLEAALIHKESDKDQGSHAAKKFMAGNESGEEALWRSGLEAQEAIDDTMYFSGNEAPHLTPE